MTGGHSPSARNAAISAAAGRERSDSLETPPASRTSISAGGAVGVTGQAASKRSSAGCLLHSGLTDFPQQLCQVAVGLGQQIQAPELDTNRLLEEFGGREVTVLDRLMEIVR